MLSKRCLAPFFLVLLLLASCGIEEPGPSPVVFVNRVAPTTAAIGDTVTIFGFGFNIAPELNVVIINGVEAIADSWSLVDPAVSPEIEQLTFVVQAGTPIGTDNIYVFTNDQTSNTNVTIDITP